MHQLDITGLTQTTWEVDGAEVHVVGFSEEPESADHAVRLLQQALGCTELEARHAHRIIEEDGEFVTSVHDDIARL